MQPTTYKINRFYINSLLCYFRFAYGLNEALNACLNNELADMHMSMYMLSYLHFDFKSPMIVLVIYQWSYR